MRYFFFFLFPSFVLSLSFARPLAHSLVSTLSRVYASVRPIADTKYTMHCFEAFVKSIREEIDRDRQAPDHDCSSYQLEDTLIMLLLLHFTVDVVAI